MPPLLVVDDDDNDATIFVRRLKDAGVHAPILHFRTGGDAFLYLKQYCDGPKVDDERPDIMFLDVNMPDLSGFDVLLWARQQPALKGLKIVMLSGATETWDAQIAAKLGANGYLVKFPSVDRLASLLAARAFPEAKVAPVGKLDRAPAAPEELA